MHILSRQFSLKNSDSNTRSLVFPYPDSLVPAVPFNNDSNPFSLKTSFLKSLLIPSPSKFTHSLKVPRRTPDCIVNIRHAEKIVISITGHIPGVNTDSVSLFEKCDVRYGNELYFCIDTGEDRVWAINAERMESFWITINIISFLNNNGLQVSEPRLQNNSRTRREHLGVGRMTCILNQKFKL